MENEQRTIFFGLDPNVRKEILGQIEENEKTSQRERRNNEHFGQYGNGRWCIYGKGLDDYMLTFSSVCKLPDLYAFLQGRGEMGRGVYALDFMGEGTAIRDLGGRISGGAFVTLTDRRPAEKRVHDKEHNINPIIGDVFLRDTWRRIDQIVKEFGGFDLIFCRPEGGLNTLLESIQPHMLVFEKLLQLLKEDGGMLLSQIPNAITRWILEAAVSHPDVEILYGESHSPNRCARYVLGLVKKHSPRRITSFAQQTDRAQLVTA